MMELRPDECRVLGVLVEKAQTTPAQYPLTLNALVAGCNQKNNRDPVTDLSEEAVLTAIDGLRAKQLVREVMLSGSRVAKYKHNARETFNVGTNELIVLTELFLRGPQTVGELRGRASRMHPLESTEIVESVLRSLIDRTPPFVKRHDPAPGSRAATYAQLLCPDLHPMIAHSTSSPAIRTVNAAESDMDSRLQPRVERLESEIKSLRNEIAHIRQALQLQNMPHRVD